MGGVRTLLFVLQSSLPHPILDILNKYRLRTFYDRNPKAQSHATAAEILILQ